MEHELQLLRKALEHSSDAIFVTDGEEVFRLVNPEFTRLYGYSPEEVLGRCTPAILLNGSALAQPPDLLRRLRTERVVTTRSVNRTKAGEPVSIESRYSAICDEEGRLTGYVAIQRHLGSINGAEGNPPCPEEMEAIAQLAGDIAHDFNNLMTTVIGYADLLLQEPALTEAIRSDLAAIRMAGEKAASLLKPLTALRHRHASQARVVKLSAAAARS